MGEPEWWRQRRFGLLVQASVATVPSWAPIGQYSSWYRAHLESGTRDTLLHPSPLVETLAHHRDRWDHIEHYDDFIPFLTFDEFDADTWTALARDAGMSYLVAVAKHHDGLCWWDAPNTDRTVLDAGPERDVVGEFSAACERAELAFGVHYSLLDWADPRYPGCTYVDEVVHPHVLDLVHRYGARLLWGDGHWGAGADHWRSDELVAAARRIDPDIVVNDRWWAEATDVRSFEYRMPADILTTPWELRRGLGGGLGYNRAETADHLLEPGAVVALLTEVVAKGGRLLLAVGPDAAGRIPALYADCLRTVGGWVRRHVGLVDRGRPWTTWGDHNARYIVVDGTLHAVDIGGRGRFPALGLPIGRVTAVEGADGTPMLFEQHADGLTLARQPRRSKRMPTVYRIHHDPPPPAPIELFPSSTRTPVELAPLIEDARPGSIVQLGDDVYLGPARIPDGVTVRGLGPDRTTIDGLESVAVVLGAGSRLEHCAVTGGGDRIVWLPKSAVAMVGNKASLLGCRIDGHVEVSGSHARVTSCTLTGVVAREADGVNVSRSTFCGMQWDCAVDVYGGVGHLVEGCEIGDVLQGVRLHGTVGAAVRGNRICARWWGVQLIDTEASSIVGNSMANTMRAVDVDGGTLAEITGNAVSDGDSGCVIQRGASDVEVSGNHWERCRMGMMAWDAGAVHHYANSVTDLHDRDADVVVGP